MFVFVLSFLLVYFIIYYFRMVVENVILKRKQNVVGKTILDKNTIDELKALNNITD